MGFLLYKVDTTATGQQAWTHVRPLNLARPGGVLARWLQANDTVDLPWHWELSGEALIAALAPDVDAGSHAIAMDLNPGAFTGASLCHVSRIVGNSQADETDIVLVMRELSCCGPSCDAATLKAHFEIHGPSSGPELVESIGLSGGTRRGTYRWCAPMMNIGAAIIGSRCATPAHS